MKIINFPTCNELMGRVIPFKVIEINNKSTMVTLVHDKAELRHGRHRIQQWTDFDWVVLKGVKKGDIIECSVQNAYFKNNWNRKVTDLYESVEEYATDIRNAGTATPPMLVVELLHQSTPFRLRLDMNEDWETL